MGQGFCFGCGHLLNLGMDSLCDDCSAARTKHQKKPTVQQTAQSVFDFNCKQMGLPIQPLVYDDEAALGRPLGDEHNPGSGILR